LWGRTKGGNEGKEEEAMGEKEEAVGEKEEGCAPAVLVHHAVSTSYFIR
jgi:hypothetical protein